MPAYKQTTRILKAILILFLVTGSTYACAYGKYDGKWYDNGNQITRIGNLIIKKNTITISGLAKYKVSLVGNFGKGVTYRVESVNRHPDPLGCTKNSNVTYISIIPKGKLIGLNKDWIMVLFYGGKSPPNIKTYSNDMYVCEMHPFSK